MHKASQADSASCIICHCIISLDDDSHILSDLITCILVILKLPYFASQYPLDSTG